MNTNTQETGIVLSYHSNFYTVQVGETLYQCFLRGMLKKEGTDVLVGDKVLVDNVDTANGAARVYRVLDRANQLSRPKIANITAAMVVASIQSPAMDLVQLDRYLTHIQLAGIDPLICISKADLASSPSEIDHIEAIYKPLGIPVSWTRLDDAESINRVKTILWGKTVVLAGLSGTGKSSLINALSPQLNLSVQDVSAKLQRGQHTTRHVTLVHLGEESYIADTPGFSYLKFDQVTPQAIESAFPDFAPFRETCYFDNCLHLEELDCHVKSNLNAIAPSRYDSYQLIQAEALAALDTLQSTSKKQELGYKRLRKGKTQDLQILKLSEKQREASRRTQRQQVADWQQEEEEHPLEDV